MSQVQEQTLELKKLMRDKLGVRAGSFSVALRKAGRRLPRSMRRYGRELAIAEGLSEHPKLRNTLDKPRLDMAASRIREHLTGIDVSDRRKGYFLGVLGAIAFNILVIAAILMAILMWRGCI